MMGADYYRWADADSRGTVRGPAFPGIGFNTRIENAIIDKNASVGNDCVITNAAGVGEGEGPGFYIRDSIVVIIKNAVIQDGTVI
jgi:glucose-1-phosphate adenylyltransferase